MTDDADRDPRPDRGDRRDRPEAPDRDAPRREEPSGPADGSGGSRSGDAGRSRRTYILAVVLSVGAVAGAVVLVPVLVPGYGNDGRVPPEVSVEFDHDAASDTVTVTHAGGAAVTEHSARQLVVVVREDGRTVREVVWYDRDWEDADGVSAGDDLTVAADPGQRVVVVVRPTERVQQRDAYDRSVVVGDYTVPAE